MSSLIVRYDIRQPALTFLNCIYMICAVSYSQARTVLTDRIPIPLQHQFFVPAKVLITPNAHINADAIFVLISGQFTQSVYHMLGTSSNPASEAVETSASAILERTVTNMARVILPFGEKVPSPFPVNSSFSAT